VDEKKSEGTFTQRPFVAVSYSLQTVVLTWRGTTARVKGDAWDDILAWFYNFHIIPVTLTVHGEYSTVGPANMHKGWFILADRAYSWIKKTVGGVMNHGMDLIICGHSQGGALTHITNYFLLVDVPDAYFGVTSFAFAVPLPGSDTWAAELQFQLLRTMSALYNFRVSSVQRRLNACWGKCGSWSSDPWKYYHSKASKYKRRNDAVTTISVYKGKAGSAWYTARHYHEDYRNSGDDHHIKMWDAGFEASFSNKVSGSCNSWGCRYMWNFFSGLVGLHHMAGYTAGFTTFNWERDIPRV